MSYDQILIRQAGDCVRLSGMIDRKDYTQRVFVLAGSAALRRIGFRVKPDQTTNTVYLVIDQYEVSAVLESDTLEITYLIPNDKKEEEFVGVRTELAALLSHLVENIDAYAPMIGVLIERQDEIERHLRRKLDDLEKTLRNITLAAFGEKLAGEKQERKAVTQGVGTDGANHV